MAQEAADDLICDDCQRIARPWSRGRAAMQYRDLGRKLVLGLKHGDRQDIAPLAANWLMQAARPLFRDNSVIVPIPLHWTRLVKRRYNQSALLAQHLALKTGKPAVVDGLVRQVRTQPLDGATVEERFDRLQGTIHANPRTEGRLRGQSVILVDDVMTSGATFAAATEACTAAGAVRVDVLALARVCKED